MAGPKDLSARIFELFEVIEVPSRGLLLRSRNLFAVPQNWIEDYSC